MTLLTNATAPKGAKDHKMIFNSIKNVLLCNNLYTLANHCVEAAEENERVNDYKIKDWSSASDIVFCYLDFGFEMHSVFDDEKELGKLVELVAAATGLQK